MSDIIFNRVKVYGPNKEAKEFIHTLSNMLSDCTINGSTVEFMTYCEPAFYILETIKLSNSRLSLLLDYKSRNGRLNGFVYANNGKYLNIITNKGKIPSPTLPIEKNQTQPERIKKNSCFFLREKGVVIPSHFRNSSFFVHIHFLNTQIILCKQSLSGACNFIHGL